MSGFLRALARGAANASSGARGIPGRGTAVSTRFPTAARRTEDPLRDFLTINSKIASGGDHAQNVQLLSRYPGFAHLGEMDTMEAVEAYINQGKDNINFLLDRIPEDDLSRISQWYDGANRFSDALAGRYGLPRQSVSANIAAQSPQKDWFQNASLGERLLEGYSRRTLDPITSEEVDWMRSNDATMRGHSDAVAQISPGMRLQDLADTRQRAIALRAWDEANNPRSYRALSPTGELGDFVLTQDGTPRNVAWGSYNEIGNAVDAIESGGDMDIISGTLGQQHKVRNFYNDIEDPMKQFSDPMGSTADTHAVAANQLRPLSSNSFAVQQNFGSAPGTAAREGLIAQGIERSPWQSTKNSSITGVRGTYGINSDVNAAVAQDRSVLGRQGQSMGWEAVRALFTDTQKRDPNFLRAIDDIWSAADRGEISHSDARELIFDRAGGFKGYDFGRSSSGGVDPTRASTYR